MNKKTLLFPVIMILLLAGPSLYADWATVADNEPTGAFPDILFDATAFNNGRHMARETDGTLWIIYLKEDLSTQYRGYMTVSLDDGQTWALPTLLPNVGWGEKAFFSIAMDSNDTLHIVFSRTGNIYYMEKDDTENFSAPIQLDTIAETSIQPSIAVDASDNLYVVWEQGTPGKIMYTKRTGNTWDLTPTVISDGLILNAQNQGSPAIGVGPSPLNLIHIVWHGNSNTLPGTQIWSKVINGAQHQFFRVSIAAGQGSADQYFPTLAVSTDGIARVAWVEGAPGAGQFIYTAHYNGQWQTPDRISGASAPPAGEYLLPPTNVIRPNGDVQVAWPHVTNPVGTITEIHSAINNGTWQAPFLLDPLDQGVIFANSLSFRYATHHHNEGELDFIYTNSHPTGATQLRYHAIESPPVADAGPDQNNVPEQTTVFLDGTNSYDPDGDLITYAWHQAAGSPNVTLINDDTATPQFDAPDVDGDSLITFQLIVNDGNNNHSDFVDVTLINSQVNIPPLSNAGAAKVGAFTAGTPAVVNMSDATASDPDSFPGPFTLNWTFQSGPNSSVLFSNRSIMNPDVTFPEVPGAYVLRFTANDGAASSMSFVTVNITQNNIPPISFAGADKADSIFSGNPIVITMDDATANDPDNFPSSLSTTWSLPSGPMPVSFSDPNTLMPDVTFSFHGIYTLRLAVDDGGPQPPSLDDVQVIINATPNIDAGSNKADTFTLGNPSVVTMNNATASDPDNYPNPSLDITWSLQSGPGAVSFSDNKIIQPDVTFPELAGTYTLLLSVDDGAGPVSDTVNVTLSQNNIPPTVNVGGDKAGSFTIGNPASVVMTATANDPDSQPNPSLTYSWTVQSAQSGVSFSPNANVLNPTVNFPETADTYTLRLTVVDGADQALDELDVVITQNNIAPTAEAGINKGDSFTTGNPSVVTMNDATASDADNYPNSALDITWSLQSGPGAVSFSDNKIIQPDVTFPELAGTYTLLLSVDDGAGPITDTVDVTISQNNIPPTFEAGTNKADSFTTGNPSVVTMNDATASDPDNFPNPSLDITWSLQSGPGAVSFSDNKIIQPDVTFPELAGTYTLLLSVDDGAGPITDTVDVTISQNNIPPTFEAGTNKADSFTTGNPSVVTMNDATASDPDNFPNPSLDITWSLQSGPGAVSFSDNKIIQPDVTFPELAGTYTLLLSVDDGAGPITDTVDVTISQNNIPPTFEAGTNKADSFTTGNPSVVTMNDATASDPDNYPNPSLDITWSLQSGPGAVSFSDNKVIQPDVTFPELAGTYTLLLSVDDGAGPVTDTIDVTISQNNIPPTVGVGSDKAGSFTQGNPTSVLMTATANDPDSQPNPLTHTWTVVSAQPGVTFSPNANVLNPTVTFPESADTYTLRLTVDDGAVQPFDELDVVITQTNISPTADAGIDKADSFITGSPAVVTMNDAAASDPDNFPNPALDITWSIQSGPGAVSFSDNKVIQPDVTFPELAGTYTLLLSVDDGAGPVTDTIDVTISQNNIPPTVEAGTNKGNSFTTGNPAVVNMNDATASDPDNYPNPSLDITWSLQSGPGAVSFSDNKVIQPDVTFAEVSGVYTLLLAVDDGAGPITDTVNVTLSQNNIPPTVGVGSDKAGSFAQGNPASVVMTATANDPDSQPNPLTHAWTVESAQPGVTFSPNANVLNPTVTFPEVADIYTLRLTVDDGAVQPFDELDVVITQNNIPPTLDAGTNKGTSFTMGNPAVVNMNDATASDPDNYPNPALDITWSLQSGPGTVSFSDNKVIQPDVTFPELAGTYTLLLSVDDGAGPVTDTIDVTISQTNISPTTDAGIDKADSFITGSPAVVTMNDASASDPDNFPNPSLDITWSLQSGPGTVSFSDNKVIQPDVTFAEVSGVYTLLLAVDDGAFLVTDTVDVTLSQNNIPPLSNAGTAKVDTFSTGNPAVVAMSDATASDPDSYPNAFDLTWAFDSGPNNAISFSNNKTLQPNVTFPETAGIYTLSLTAFDGLVSSVSLVTVDISQTSSDIPSVSFILPTAGSWVSGNAVTLGANASDLDGIDRVEFYLDDTQNPTIGSVSGPVSPFNTTWDTTGIINETHLLIAVAFDTLGNSNQAIIPINIDNSPPSTIIDSPGIEGEYVSGTIFVNAIVNEVGSGLQNVTISIAGGAPISVGPSAPFSTAWISNSVNDGGPYTIVATATDLTTLPGTYQRTIFVDNTYPVTTIDNLSEGQILDHQSPPTTPIQVSIQDQNIDYVLLFINNTYVGQSNTLPYTYDWDSSADGNYAIRAEGYDLAGNMHPQTINVIVNRMAANTPPEVSAGDFIALDFPIEDTATLTGSYTDDGLPNGGSITILWEEINSPVNQRLATITNASTLNPIVNVPDPGIYTFQLTVSDGDLSATAIQVVSAGNAVSGANINILSPNQPYINTDPIRFSWNVSDIPLGTIVRIYAFEVFDIYGVDVAQRGEMIVELPSDFSGYGEEIFYVLTYAPNNGINLVHYPFTIDTVKPTVAITNRNDGDHVSGLVPIIVNITDQSGLPQEVNFYINNVLLQTHVMPDANNDYTFSWNTLNQAQEDLYEIRIQAIDMAGNEENDTVFLKVVDPPLSPGTVIPHPANGSFITADQPLEIFAEFQNANIWVQPFIDDPNLLDEALKVHCTRNGQPPFRVNGTVSIDSGRLRFSGEIPENCIINWSVQAQDDSANHGFMLGSYQFTRPVFAAEGATIQSSDGRLTLEIPPGALTQDLHITINNLNSPGGPVNAPGLEGADVQIIAGPYDIIGLDHQGNRHKDLRSQAILIYSEPPGGDPNRVIQVQGFDENGNPKPIVLGEGLVQSQVELGGRSIRHEISSLNMFQVVSFLSLGNGMSRFYNYPNPFSTSHGTKFHYLLGEDSQVDIVIYDLFGRLVKKISIPAGSPGGVAGQNIFNWDGRNGDGTAIASGGYLVRAFASSTTGIKTKVKYKMLVIN